MDLTDENGESVWGYSRDIYDGSASTPKQWSDQADLEAGIYYIKISQSSDYTGKYDLKVGFNTAGNNETEPNNGTSQAQPITLNTQKINGFLSLNDDTDCYKFILKQAGTIDVHVDSNIYNVSLNLLDENGNDVWGDEDIYGESSQTPKQWSKSVDLEAGTYYIKISNSSGYTGKYNLYVNYTPAGNNEVEPNNSTSQAQELSNGQKVTGFLSWSDDTDVYKVNLPKAGNLKISLDSSIDWAYVDLIDANGNNIWDDYIYDGSIETPKQWNKSESLPAGTYYLKISSDYNTGKYVLSVNAPLYPSAPSINTVSTNSTSVSGKTDANCTVYVKAGSKTYKGKSNNKGDYKVSIPKQKAGTKIYVYATNTYGKSGTKSVTVVDRIAPSTPSVNTVSHTSRYITGKTEAYATVTAYTGSKKIGSAKADKHGSYKIKISPKKKGTVVKVKATDKSGNSSGYRTVKVK
ncbi:Ig-like domain-containing protein [Weizmannia sp. FSL W8-1119]|uniref:Ig-like domain-containing protein n=1 Tax=Weizmannia sp. FSL W8-1119 TaxID=2954709 RepID=UPI0030F72BF6